MNSAKPALQTNIIERDLLADVLDVASRREAGVMAPQAPLDASETQQTKDRYRAKERKRQAKLREELEITLPASVTTPERDGWREDPQYSGMAFHPTYGYVRYLAFHGLEKKGYIAVQTDRKGRAFYEFRHRGERVYRYVENLLYDCGFSAWNPYVRLRQRLG